MYNVADRGIRALSAAENSKVLNGDRLQWNNGLKIANTIFRLIYRILKNKKKYKQLNQFILDVKIE